MRLAIERLSRVVLICQTFLSRISVCWIFSFVLFRCSCCSLLPVLVSVVAVAVVVVVFVFVVSAIFLYFVFCIFSFFFTFLRPGTQQKQCDRHEQVLQRVQITL